MREDSERLVDIGAHQPRQGEYLVLAAQLPGRRQEVIAVLLLDLERDALYIQLRRDWRSIANQEDIAVLEELENDLEAKAREFCGAALLAQLEPEASWTVQLSARNSVSVNDFKRYLAPSVPRARSGHRAALQHTLAFVLARGGRWILPSQRG